MSRRRLKTFAEVIAGQSPASEDVHPLDNGTPFIQGNAEFGHRHPTPIWESSAALKLARKGDILVSVRAPIGAVNIATGPIGLGRGVAAVRAAEPSVQDWLYWALIASHGELQSKGTGSTFTAITADDLKTLALSLPTQPAIVADYLDHETSEIDALVADIEAEEQLALERHYTTLDLAINGLPRTMQLRRVANLRTGRTPKNVDRVISPDSSGIPWVTPGDIRDADKFARPQKFIPKEFLDGMEIAGAVNLAVVGIGATIGAVAMVNRPFCTNQQLTSVEARGVNPSFLYHILVNSRSWIRANSGGTTLPIISNSRLGSLPIPCATLDTQARIASDLDKSLASAEENSHLARTAITLAKERRAALITAAVTGQIDVTAKRRPAAEQLEDDIKELS